VQKNEVDLDVSCIILVKLTDNRDVFPCFASLFAEDAEEKAKKEAEENAQQGSEEKKAEEKDEKPDEDATAAKTENSKEPNPGENKSADSSKNHVNGTRQTGVNKHEASQGKNTPRTDKGTDCHYTVGEDKQHVQNGEFSPSTKT